MNQSTMENGSISHLPPPSGPLPPQPSECVPDSMNLNATPALQPNQPQEIGDSMAPKKRGSVARGRRRKRPRDVNAPKQPLNGYVRFLNENREKTRTDNPQASFSDITKLLAQEWTKLTPPDKQKYFDEAEKDKERYLKELEQYQQTEAYRIFTAKKLQDKKRRELMDETEPSNTPQGNVEKMRNLKIFQQPIMPEPVKKEDDFSGFDIPIFTEEFLDHNKARETELRQLRKSNTEFEEQNAILSKHIDNMKAAISKLEVETVQQRNNNFALQQHLDNLRATLTANFANVPLPGSNEMPTLETIDSYMSKLHTMILDSPQENENLISTVREIVGRLDYQG